MEPQKNTGTGNKSLHASQPIFSDFLFTNKVNKTTLILCGIMAVAQFVIFKIYFPFASFMPDSSAYIAAAKNNTVINTWPIGYSWFLRLFGLLSHSDMLLVLFQYLLLVASGLYFVYTLLYLVQPGRIVQYLLPLLFVLSPLLLVTANYVSSDALFIGLSFIWAAQLLWLIYKPSSRVLTLHVIVLFLAFIVRFNSLYYPLISAVVIMLSRFRLSIRLAVTGLSFLSIAAFGWYCSSEYKSLTGERQLAAFAGWQLAGNALYAYSHSNERIEQVPAPFATLHRMVNRHMDSLNRLPQRPDASPGIYYQWQGPLAQYYIYRYPGEKNLTNFKNFASLAPLYKSYGMYLIKAKPAMYIKHFLWPNLVQFYAPPAEFLGRYNIYSQVNNAAQQWFGYRNTAIKGYSTTFAPLEYMTIFSAILNIAFAGSLAGFVWMRGFRRANKLSPFLLLTTALWVANMGFSVLASPIVLRYQLFILTIIGCAGVLLIEFLYNSDSVQQPYAPVKYSTA